MPILHPIFLIVITFLNLFVVIINSIQNEKIIKFSLFFSFFNLALSIVVLFVYDEYILGNELYSNIYFGYSVFSVFVFFVNTIRTFKTSVLKANHYQLFVKSIRESSWNAYYVVDRKERIKDISDSFLNELGLEKEQVIGLKLFKVFDKSIRFLKLNGIEITNKKLEGRYLDYRKTAKIGDSEVEEIIFSNHEGKLTALKVMLQPVFVFGKYRGRTVAGEIKSDFDLLGVEKELSKNQQVLDSVSDQLNAALKLSVEGFFLIDLTSKNIGVNDKLRTMLNLPDETLNLDDFRKLIEPSDLVKYLGVISELSHSRPSYTIKYRILLNGNYVWAIEKGIRLFEDLSQATIMGTINFVNVKHFRSSNIDVLDKLEDSFELVVGMNHLLEENRHFYLMLFEVTNIPEINDLHGWQVGNMFLADYVEKIKSIFMTENSGIYRISGLLFAVLITNPHKMDLLKKGAYNQKDFLDNNIIYGSINETLIVKAGIAVSKEDASRAEHLYQVALEALNITKNPRYTHNVAFYKDVINDK